MPELFKVAAEKCTGCGQCLLACPFLAIVLTEGGTAEIAESCVECGVCLSVCAEGAIIAGGAEGADREAARGGGPRQGLGRQSGGFVVLLPPGDLAPGLAVLSLARRLADEEGKPVVAVSLDRGLAADTPSAADRGGAIFAAGADRLLLVPEASTLPAAVLAEGPLFVLAPAGHQTSPVMAGTAALIGAPYLAGVDEIEAASAEEARLVVHRPLYGGRFRVRLAARGGRESPVFVTLLPTAVGSIFKDRGRAGIIETYVAAPDSGGMFHDGEGGAKNRPLVLPEDRGWREVGREHRPAAISPADARIVLAGGAGLKDRDSFVALRRLGAALGAAVAVSKDALDAGLVRPEDGLALIDAAATVIAPALYVAFGVEGSPSHNAAVAKSLATVVVSERPDAPVTQIADYVIVRDPGEVLRAWLQNLVVIGSAEAQGS